MKEVRKILLWAFIIVLISLCKASKYVENEEITERKAGECPGNGNCNNHGICTNGQCTCNSGWAGDDCSFPLTAVTSGQRLNNQYVASRNWQFYSIVTTSGTGLTVTLNETRINSVGDSDTYLQKSAFPTRNSYVQKNDGVDVNYQVVISNPAAATWYIGVYGFMNTNYSIKFMIDGSQCPLLNNCNPPNGVCVSAGQCQCNSNFIGADCSKNLTTVSVNTRYSGTVRMNEWKYYQISITAGNSLVFVVNETSQSGDVDLYIKFNGVPSQFDYFARDIGTEKNFALNLNNPDLGTWYIGILGFKPTDYSMIVLDTTQKCPTKCSKHGVCTGSTCNCDSKFNGLYCQNMVGELSLGSNQTGYVDSRNWNYYHFSPSSQSNLIVTVGQSASADFADCDLYVKEGQNPTTLNYDFRDIGFNTTMSINIADPGDSTWYFGVYGYRPCEYNIRVDLTAACPGIPMCSGNGKCTNGVCQCNGNFSGAACDQKFTSLLNGPSSSGSVDTNNWIFYTIYVRNTTYLTINLVEQSTVGYLWLFANRGSIAPDLRNYDYSEKQTKSKFHRLHLTFPSAQTTLWTIGVYGNPFSQRGAIPFAVSAWYSPF